MNLLVDGGALLLIAFIVWWFWLYRAHALPAVASAAGNSAVVEIIVADGVYTPAEIAVPVGRDTVLRFLRRDRSPCAAMVLIDALGISADLLIDMPVDVTVHPPAAGRYEFTCQMRMYRGTLIAVAEAGK
ncbi:MAG: cupredoxin domain-containing protein [Actinomycetota bacterium]|nr:cupredoxin domain-containing protein [Actinomycetota bacterium]